MNLTLLSFVIKSLTLILFRDDNKLSSTEVISSRIILGMIVDSSFLIILSLKAIMAYTNNITKYKVLVNPSYKVM